MAYDELKSMRKKAAKNAKGRDGTQTYIGHGKNATGMTQPGWTAEQIKRGYKTSPVRPQAPCSNKKGGY